VAPLWHDRLIHHIRNLKDGQLPVRMYGSGRHRKLIHRKFVKYPTMMAIDLKGSLLELEEIPERSTILKNLKMPAGAQPRNLSSP
jgi:hypothetical protein